MIEIFAIAASIAACIFLRVFIDTGNRISFVLGIAYVILANVLLRSAVKRLKARATARLHR